MDRRKIISLLTAFVLIVSMFGVSADANVIESEMGVIKPSDEMVLSQEDVFEAIAYTFGEQGLKEAISAETALSPTGALLSRFDSEDYSKYTNNEYGGMYINDYGVLVLCYVEGSDAVKALQETNVGRNIQQISTALVNSNNEVVAEKYMFKSVKYSEQELLSAYELANQFAKKNSTVKTVDVDYFKNRIIIGIEAAADIESVNQGLSSIKGMYACELLEEGFEAIDVATINGISAINNGNIASTPAGKLLRSDTMTWGIVTCGHGWAAGDDVYSGNTKIGKVIYRHYDGVNDSSLIELNSGHNYQGEEYDYIDSSIPVVGSTLTLRGFVSGRISGARVLSINSSATTSGTYFTGMIKCDKPLQSGDSGGGAIGGYADGGRTALILAINKATSESACWLIKGKVICDAY